MMPAIGLTFAIKGSTKKDIEIAKRIINSYIGKSYFDSQYGDGEILPIVSFVVDIDFDVLIDLSEDGVASINLKGYSRMGIINYKDEQREKLLEQLILMFSGYRYMEQSVQEIMPIFERGCSFNFVECSSTKQIKVIGTSIFNEIVEQAKGMQLDVFLQVTNAGLVESIDMFKTISNCNLLHDEAFQIVLTESDIANTQLAFFYH